MTIIAMTLDELQGRLKALCPRPLVVKIGQNRSTYAQARLKKDGSIHLTLHRMFLFSSTPVLQALIRFSFNRDRQARSVIRQMAHIYLTQIEPPIPDLSISNAKGEFFDLQVIFDSVNRSFFDQKIKASIVWFPIPFYSRFRRITFGSFDRSRCLIKINRLLDSALVPLSFIEFIVYHEMLHSVCPFEIDGRGHLRAHTAEFRLKEALYPHFALVKEWEKNSIKLFKEKYVRT